jgi:NitT/TauT family transport system ATP-binding protein
MISVRTLSKAFARSDGPFPVLDRISFDVAAGEILAIVGPSGCGKTTLLNILSSVETPSAGDVSVGSRPPAMSRVARVFQSESIFPWLSVSENVSFAARYRDDSPRDDLTQRYLREVGLEPFSGWWPKDLSGGMRRRVEIARAFAAQASVLLLDEPFIALDAFTRDEMQRLLLSVWKREPRTIVLTTHDTEEAVYLAHRVLILTTRPATVKSIVSVPFEHPRPSSLKLSEEFIRLRSAVHEHLSQYQVSAPGAPE